MRLIDADETVIRFGFEWEDIPPTTDEFIEFIKRQPTVDAEPVRHGHWVLDNYNQCSCSVCNQWFDEPMSDNNYCPHCGAKMDEVGK